MRPCLLLLLALVAAAMIGVAVDAKRYYADMHPEDMYGSKETLTICMVVANFPWKFGAYQVQGYTLSKELSNKGHKILWMAHRPDEPVLRGLYHNLDDLCR